MSKEDIGNIFRFYAESEDGVVKTPYGDDIGDLKELFEVADFFAERYGLGGCRSLEEFVQMVNETDPMVMNLLKSVAIEKNQREMDEVNSSKPDRAKMPSARPATGKAPQSRSPARSRTPAVKVGSGDANVNRANMKRFLISFGAPPQELDKACERLSDAGIPLGSQTVLLSGINDSVEIMKKLFQGLLRIRVKPYYLYQCDPIVGSAHFRTAVAKGLEIIRGLRGHTSGYAVPNYVIDAPGGGGKVPLVPDYQAGRDGDDLLIRNYEGNLYRYYDPGYNSFS